MKSITQFATLAGLAAPHTESHASRHAVLSARMTTVVFCPRCSSRPVASYLWRGDAKRNAQFLSAAPLLRSVALAFVKERLGANFLLQTTRSPVVLDMVRLFAVSLALVFGADSDFLVVPNSCDSYRKVPIEPQVRYLRYPKLHCSRK